MQIKAENCKFYSQKCAAQCTLYGFYLNTVLLVFSTGDNATADHLYLFKLLPVGSSSTWLGLYQTLFKHFCLIQKFKQVWS